MIIAAAAGRPARAGGGPEAEERLRRLPALAPLALHGYDAVSYFLPGGPVAGLPAHEVAWAGRSWRFAKGANREAFRRDPEIYAPRLGGHDPVGVAQGRIVDADPLVFAILDARLYLFRDAQRRARALAEPEILGRAEAGWPALRPLIEDPPG
ncbi:YHS domain-containing (seleno)protein [Methylobacterium segetis]|uniref:YHS domain-containing (seleno)protein n=1 Tax=Methylobacterium segetis TaxID=2488750 RepID=UPI001FE0F97D|nr:YHS domain-containing (seleno)protein [Methylobacterium segetis]